MSVYLLLRRPPRSTRTDALFPDTTRFRPPDLRRSACRTRILPMAMDRPGTGAARTAADDAQAQRGLTMEFCRDVRLPLDCGISLGPFTIPSQTYGTFNPERPNAILVYHALTGAQSLAGIHEVTGKSGRAVWVEGGGLHLANESF